jgi:hypothetical protein
MDENEQIRGTHLLHDRGDTGTGPVIRAWDPCCGTRELILDLIERKPVSSYAQKKNQVLTHSYCSEYYYRCLARPPTVM